MSPVLIPGLLRLWPNLALRGGPAWLGIRARAAALLAAYRQAADDDERAGVELDLMDLFEEAGLGALLAEAMASTGVSRGAPPAPASPDTGVWRGLPQDAPGLEALDGAESPGAPKGAEPAAPAELERRLAAETGREICAWVEGLGVDEPLAVGRRYALLFGEDAPDGGRRDGVDVPDELFQGDQAEVLVLLVGSAMRIHGEAAQTMLLGRARGATAPLRFTIEPEQAGRATLEAVFIANNRPFQRLTLSFVVGRPLAQGETHAARARGLTVERALTRVAEPQRISLTIIRREHAYELLLATGRVTRANLRIGEPELAALIEQAREALLTISLAEETGVQVYLQPEAHIPERTYRRSLAELARLGARLYQALFFAPANQVDAHRMGRLLRELSAARPLQIEVVGERFIFPWALLYDGAPPPPGAEDEPGAVDPERFWGFRHSLEYTPEFSGEAVVDLLPELAPVAPLTIRYFADPRIERKLGAGRVTAQGDFLRALPGVRLIEHSTCRELYALLNDGAADGQLLYFYCHATGAAPDEPGGVDASRITLSDGEVRLGDLHIYAPADGARLSGAPLIFLNACQSARLSPYLYDGLVPYLIAKGARGVIGTEADTPAHFAAEFAQAVFERFVGRGEPLGEALLATRRRCLEERRNVLGLLYALHCDADLRVRRAAGEG